jgi:hypothetical protein
MKFFSHIADLLAAIREFAVPSYRPERHYMRGPGPACARRSSRPSFQ